MDRITIRLNRSDGTEESVEVDSATAASAGVVVVQRGPVGGEREYFAYQSGSSLWGTPTFVQVEALVLTTP